MRAVIESTCFPREVGGWALRGVLCAASSFWWALAVGFTDPAEIAGMLGGVLIWIVCFAGFCVWRRGSGVPGGERFVSALKIAAWIKFLLTAGGWAVFAVSLLFKDDNLILGAGGVFMLPDCLLGLAAVGIVSGLSGSTQLEKLDSLGWTTLITVVDLSLIHI